MPRAILKPKHAKPLFGRHPWVYRGSIARVEGECVEGQVVRVESAEGKFLGKGYFNPKSQIAVRILTWDEAEEVDEAFWRRRLAAALELREKTLNLTATTNACRLVNSEGDGLPGLIVDQYADYLAVQFLTLGISQHRETILKLLGELRPCAGVFERSEASAIEKEGMKASVGLRSGAEPLEFIEIRENGVRFLVDVRGGHKTGFYLDQRENRAALLPYVRGKRVLDCFTYTGGFALYATAGGAAAVTALDASEKALALARRNLEQNSVSVPVTFNRADVPEELRRLRRDGLKYDVIILDPPSFTQTESGVKKALRGYKDININALRLLEPGGILFTCSCSQHITDELFDRMLSDAAAEAGRPVQILERRGQAKDHPTLAACPETRYLKCYICAISDSKSQISERGTQS